eukprot:2476549-Amphidinium_carterae.1
MGGESRVELCVAIKLSTAASIRPTSIGTLCHGSLLSLTPCASQVRAQCQETPGRREEDVQTRESGTPPAQSCL